jgi:prepilin-type N-terminal cleavage/methylation domain-containing protein
MHQHRGFTLIEISIVLVIIGLVVGGVFVGRDLIKAAEIRSTIAELEKMNAAMHTFRLKYNGLPGDLEANKAAQFGMTVRSGTDGHGDGDEIWEGCSSAATAHLTVFGCEIALVWQDLADSLLINGNYDSASDNLTVVPTGNQDYFWFIRLKRTSPDELTGSSIRRIPCRDIHRLAASWF